jgi:nicotinamide-nucleotide amidase
MNVEIINIGDELLIGQTINTNAAWMGEELAAINMNVVQHTIISDDKLAIVNAIKLAHQRADVVIITGGLGPTKDDITKHTLCEYFNTELVHNEIALVNIQRIFKQRGRELSQLNKEQALLPKNAEMIANSNGTASGMWFKQNGKHLLSIPGVPYEMKAMMEEYILPKFVELFKLTPKHRITILTEGIVESVLATILTDWENELRTDGFALAYLPSPGLVRLRITAPVGATPHALLDKVETLKAIIPEYIYGEGKQQLEEIAGTLLRDKNQTLSTAESCTGGYIAHLITSISGSSDYFKGSIVSYANEVKINSLGVSAQDLVTYGAVSQQVVEQMALGVKNLLNTDYAIATSGIAGPTGGTPEKPVGLVWIAIATPKGVFSQKFLMGENRERTIRKTALSALSMLRKELLK